MSAPNKELTVGELAHALDNSTPCPIELPPGVLRFMAEKLLEMAEVSRKPHVIWEPEEGGHSSPSPSPMDPADLTAGHGRIV